jgi:hypothetical protein
MRITKTMKVAEDFRRRIDEAIADAIEAGIRLDPLFDYAAARIEAERAVLAERSPSEEIRRRWESLGPDEPPSAMLDLDRFPLEDVTKPWTMPEYGLVNGLPPRKRVK